MGSYLAPVGGFLAENWIELLSVVIAVVALGCSINASRRADAMERDRDARLTEKNHVILDFEFFPSASREDVEAGILRIKNRGQGTAKAISGTVAVDRETLELEEQELASGAWVDLAFSDYGSSFVRHLVRQRLNKDRPSHMQILETGFAQIEWNLSWQSPLGTPAVNQGSIRYPYE